MTLEENPFLGQRGIRMLLNRPDVLRTQLRAIVRASAAGRVCVMFPMIATMEEWAAARAFYEDARASLGAPPIPVGIMVETPAAALLADQFAREADFVSIGTNDLTQYTLAMDRTNPRLAPAIDAPHPAVLRLIDQTVSGAHARKRWVGVCGSVAGDPQAVPILIGLGRMNSASVCLPFRRSKRRFAACASRLAVRSQPARWRPEPPLRSVRLWKNRTRVDCRP